MRGGIVGGEEGWTDNEPENKVRHDNKTVK
jgi:hypothetical protein